MSIKLQCAHHSTHCCRFTISQKRMRLASWASASFPSDGIVRIARIAMAHEYIVGHFSVRSYGSHLRRQVCLHYIFLFIL